ncbi:MAG: HAD family hydrolase [Dehalococcoidia bacterium]|nr:HAD family hydrolase [Dehalococcoidia bacterium]MCA9854120.1 HAD family hydrolase [Dehalococcoidia bacterium]
MSSSPRAVFFDLDDTLLDGVGAMQAAWPLVLAPVSEQFGVDVDRLRDSIRRESSEFWKDEAVVGHWRLDLEGARTICVEKAFSAEGVDPSLARQVAEHYRDAFREHSHLFPDAIATLEAIRASGLKTALLTNGAGGPQRDKIDRFELADYFDTIVIEGEFGRGKPSPDVFRHALDVVGATPDQAWHIGDNLFADVCGAQSVGLHAAWIHRERLQMREDPPAVPDRSVAHLDEITAALKL